MEKKYPRVTLPAVLNPPHLHLRQRLLFSVSCLPAQRGTGLCSDQTSSQPQTANWLTAASCCSRTGNGRRYQPATAAGDKWHRSWPSACATAHSGWHPLKFGTGTFKQHKAVATCLWEPSLDGHTKKNQTGSQEVWQQGRTYCEALNVKSGQNLN